ncbi:MAG: TetR/AcrR family transcriptional regulator [Pseudomonadota bacterium]
MVAYSAPRVGRPKSTSKRRAILNAAQDIFMDVGYERTSMDAIAAAAGVSKQTVYSHFSNKEELFSECVLAKLLDYGLDMQDHDPAAPMLPTLIETANRFLDLMLDDAVIAMHRLLIAESPAFPSLAQTFWRSGPTQLIDTLTQFFRDASHLGSVQIDEPAQAAHDFLCLVKGHYIKTLLAAERSLSDSERQAHAERCARQTLQLHDRSVIERHD